MLSTGEPTRFLLGDIGGTNARFALLAGDELSQVKHVTVADYPCVGDAISAFLSRRRTPPVIGTALLAIAGPVVGGHCAITNSPWIIDSLELRAALGVSAVRLINDFEAIALSLPQLTRADLFALGGGQAQSGEPMLVLGPGTGFGAAALMEPDGRTIPIATEAGHATLTSASRREDAIIEHLRQRFGHVSVERTISGPGLENLYQAIAAVDGVRVPARSPNDITDAAIRGDCATSRASLEMFCAMLGGVAGNLALSFRARGGIYIAGGIAPRITDFIARSEFRARFEAKGRFRGFLEGIPTYVIMHPYPTFVGLKALSETMLDETC